MNRPWHIWTLFAICLAGVLVAMGWLTHSALTLEHAQMESQRQAIIEENVRLSLWRMDSAMNTLVACENARSYQEYTAMFSPSRAYTSMYAQVGEGQIQTPSPLLGTFANNILLHFQFNPDGTLTSPQLPSANVIDVFSSPQLLENVQVARQRAAEFKKEITRQSILAALGSPELVSFVPAGPSLASSIGRMIQQAAVRAENSPDRESQQMRSDNELWNRMKQQAANASPQPSAPTLQTPVRTDAFRAVWIGETLLLVRRVRVESQDLIQGCWLDWPAIRASLLNGIKDLLPNADLRPEPDVRAKPNHMLASLPLVIIPGPVDVSNLITPSPIRFSLFLAWLCLALASAAIAVLLAGTISLSERRAAFVSAVTHELRTPLTTFRMYTEMLAQRLVPEEKRQKYLDRLQEQSERLGHLVENVLAYARLERGRLSHRLEAVSVGELFARVLPRLTERTEQAGMTLAPNVDPLHEAVCVRIDPAAVEQILANLVDNACKYAADAPDKQIEIATERNGANRLTICVRDNGPGVPRSDRRQLFKPFHKSARDAANSAPGVGLGLALSRRLARAMGGDLLLEPPQENRTGAVFALILPVEADAQKD